MKLKGIIRNPNCYFLFFFLSLYFYFLLVFDSAIYYHYYQPIFLFDRTFLKEFLLYPGGLIEWIALFFFQFFYLNWLGSLIISALFLTIFIAAYKLIGKIGNVKPALILAFLPVSLLLVLQNHYNFPLIIAVKYLFSLIFLLLYIKIANKYMILLIHLSGVIYYILGGWGYLFYIALCILYELLFSEDSKKFIYAGFNMVICFLYPYIAARYLFAITLTEAYIYIVPYELYYEPILFKPTLCFYLSYLSLPVLMVTIFVYSKYIKTELKHRTKQLSRWQHLLIQSIIIILVGIFVLEFSYKQEEKRKIQIDYLAEQGQWKELLALSFEIDKYDRQVNFNVNRALYHTGQLLDDLFNYPQLLGTDGLFIDRILGSQIAIPASDIYFDLGHINASQVLAYEGQTKFKYNPRILKRLVLTNIINGKYIVAKKFLDLLKKSILHRKWVKYYENCLFNKSLIESDNLIQSKRELRPKFDFLINCKNPNYDLIWLLKANGNNKMAFEYLMAYYLLECKMGDLIQHLRKFRDFGYRKIPRHIEEALLLIEAMSPPDIDINFNEYSISPHTVEEFRRFNKILLQNFKNDVKAKALLEKEFKNTYWYYVRYINPKQTNIMLKERKIDESLL